MSEPTLPWLTSEDDPVLERIIASAGRSLLGVETLGDGGGRSAIKLFRATTNVGSIDTGDLSTCIWCDDPVPADAPFGQQGWRVELEICTYVRENEDSGVPIDRRLLFVAADVQAALMRDRRRGGLCHVDNTFGKTIFLDGGEDGTSSCRVYLVCEYRTLVDDPRTPAPAATNELYWQGGATLYIAPKLNQFAAGPWRRYADVRVIPRVEAATETIDGDAGGISRPVAQRYAGHTIQYEVQAGYINTDLIVRQIGGGAVETAAQAGGTYADVPHAVVAHDALVPLTDATARPVFGVTAVAAVKSQDGTSTYAAGTDYLADPSALRDGMLMVPSGSTIPIPSGVRITFTALSQSRPSIVAGTACSADVRARIVWTASDGTQLVHSDFDGSLLVTAATFAPGDLAASTLTLTVLDDGSGTPLGRYLMPAGPKPAVGY